MELAAMLSNAYLYKKVIDWSVLNYGINIPISLQMQFYESMNFKMKKGDNKKITLLLEGKEYAAVLTNIPFDVKKYPTHKELLQIRYTSNSPIAKHLQEVFNTSYVWLRYEKEKLENKRMQLIVPEDKREYMAIYSTNIDNYFLCECITYNELTSARESIKLYSEIDIERLLEKQDETASITSKEKIVKIRKLDKSISDGLKHVYSYKCQICGLAIGEKYNSSVIHAHHIDPFVKTLNNNSDNIIIICPNHHSIIHDVNPIFVREKKVFLYPNGYTEGLSLNMHL
jgi:5-methylcytosine-specific restriction enzyme A